MPPADALPVHCPASAAAAGGLVREAVAAGHGVYPAGRGTEPDPGVPRPKPGVVLDTTALVGVVDYPARDMTVTVRAGTPVADLTAVLAAENQRLPVDLGDGTLGGAVASNRSGPRRLGFGTLRDYLIGVRFLTPAGDEVSGGGRVVKNVAGYDLMKLHTGAFGTLGVLTELTFKVVPRPDDTAVVLFGLNPAALGPTLDRLHQSASRPVAVEVFSRAAAEDRRLPVAEPWVLAVGFEGKAETVAWQVETLLAELQSAPARGTVSHRGADAGPAWDAITRRPAGEGVLFGGTARPSRLADVLLSPAVAADRVSAGGLVGTFTVESSATAATAAGEQLAALRTAAGDGHVGVRRRPAGWENWRPPAGRRGDHALMLAVKTALDPTDVFNPGRLLPLA